MGKIRLFHAVLALFLVVATNAKKDEKKCEVQVTRETKFQVVKESIISVKTLSPQCGDSDDKDEKFGRTDRSMSHLNLGLEKISGLNKVNEVDGEDKKEFQECPQCPPPKIIGGIGPVDCSEIYQMGYKKSGVYSIYPKSRVSDQREIKVYCDMDTDGGGWTVIQRRGNFTEQIDFYQDWETYKNGFGDVEKSFWLGNDNIFTLTNQGVYSIRIDLQSAKGEYRYSKHDNFWIGDEESNYVLHLHNFTGNVTNDFSKQNNRMFSTKDRQNDGHAAHDACAVRHHGAWWWPPTSGCGHLNLNGVYMPGETNMFSVWWWDWQHIKGLFFVEMKIRHRYANLG